MKKYEKFIMTEAKKGNKSEELFRLHTEMVRNFQHERLVHELIMIMFVFLTVGLVFLTMGLMIFGAGISQEFLWLLYALDLIMVGLTVAYVRHYYFLENHTQRLYEWFYKIWGK